MTIYLFFFPHPVLFRWIASFTKETKKQNHNYGTVRVFILDLKWKSFGHLPLVIVYVTLSSFQERSSYKKKRKKYGIIYTALRNHCAIVYKEMSSLTALTRYIWMKTAFQIKLIKSKYVRIFIMMNLIYITLYKNA